MSELDLTFSDVMFPWLRNKGLTRSRGRVGDPWEHWYCGRELLVELKENRILVSTRKPPYAVVLDASDPDLFNKLNTYLAEFGL